MSKTHWRNLFKTPGLYAGKIESILWVGLCVAFTYMLGSGEANGIGSFQQPEQNLYPLLITGCLMNSFFIWLIGIRIFPFFYLRESYFRLLLALLLALCGICLVKALSDLLLVLMVYPELGFIPLIQHLEDNFLFTLGIFALAVPYGLIKSIIHKSKRLSNGSIVIRSGKQLFRFKTSEVDYFEAQGNHVKVVGDFKSELVYCSMGRLEKKMDPAVFTRVHRSYIVALGKASRINNKSLLFGEKSIPVSEKYLKKVREQSNRIKPQG